LNPFTEENVAEKEEALKEEEQVEAEENPEKAIMFDAEQSLVGVREAEKFLEKLIELKKSVAARRRL